MNMRDKFFSPSGFCKSMASKWKSSFKPLPMPDSAPTKLNNSSANRSNSLLRN